MNLLSSLLYFILEKIGTLNTRVNAIPTIYASTSDPRADDGSNGDIWFKYNA